MHMRCGVACLNLLVTAASAYRVPVVASTWSNSAPKTTNCKATNMAHEGGNAGGGLVLPRVVVGTFQLKGDVVKAIVRESLSQVAEKNGFTCGLTYYDQHNCDSET